jgi:hypothetical protein
MISSRFLEISGKEKIITEISSTGKEIKVGLKIF